MTAIAKAINIMVRKGYAIIDINPCVGSTYADLFVVSDDGNGYGNGSGDC